jgi:flagellar protein FliO/FliZ
MSTWLTALAGPDPAGYQAFELGSGLRGMVAALSVLGLVVLFAWLLRRGVFGPFGRRRQSPIRIETAAPLGDRRSLAIVAVEGRRLLVGLAPGHISLLAELRAEPSFPAALDQASGSAGGGGR